MRTKKVVKCFRGKERNVVEIDGFMQIKRVDRRYWERYYDGGIWENWERAPAKTVKEYLTNEEIKFLKTS